MGSNRDGGVRRAIFLDRDGVLNQNILNPSTGEYESPLTPEKFVLLPGVIAALRLLRASGYWLFVVSNQPNYAKGKTSMGTLNAIHHKFEAILQEEEISFEAFYYCFHHPAFTGECACRKPSPFFLLKARDAFAVSLADSWMIGDRSSDIVCGRAAGTRTVRICDSSLLQLETGNVATDLWSATQLILASQRFNRT
jgi:D-glycero-D-manno-heptose 1,7-bisphosphate phosphatase